MKIIFLIDCVFSDRDFERLGVSQMQKRSIEVEFWNLQKMRNQKIDIQRFEEQSSSVVMLGFETYSELEGKCGELINSFVIDLRSEIHTKYSTCWFKKHGAYIVKLEQGHTPLAVWQPTVIDRIVSYREILLNIGYYSFVKRILSKCLRQTSRHIKTCNFDIKICSGTASKCSNANFCVEAHSLDYNVFLRVGGTSTTGDYIVFLDNGMTDHPDYEKLSLRPYSTPNMYFPSMNRLFDMIEAKTETSVIISAHPRLTNLAELSSYYGGRKVVSEGTAELVRDSMLVLAHDTTAISFAVLWKKPLLVVNTDQLERSNFAAIKSLCSLLNIDAVNADCIPSKFDWLSEAEKPKKRYSIYKEMLLKKTGSTERNSWDIFADKLKQYELTVRKH